MLKQIFISCFFVTCFITNFSNALPFASKDPCVDIIFLVDESRVLLQDKWIDSFSQMKDFIKSTADKFTIGLNKTRIAVVGFGSYAELQVGLYSETKQDFEKYVDDMILISEEDPEFGARNIADAFDITYTLISNNERNPKTPIYAVLVTVYSDDQNTEDVVSKSAAKLQQFNVELSLVAMTDFNYDDYFKHEIQSILNSFKVSKLYELKNYSELENSTLNQDLRNEAEKESNC